MASESKARRAQCSAKGGYFIDRLNRKWMQEESHGAIDVLQAEQWSFFNGAHYTKIKFANLLQRQTSRTHLERD
jgi:hypothetical protein